MKILNITKTFEKNIYGGVESLIDQLCYKLVRYNIKSDVYTIKKKSLKKKPYMIYSDKENFNVYSTPISFSSILKFRRIADEYDILNFHFPWPFMDILSLFVFNKKIVVTYHSDITQKKLLFYLYIPLMFLFLI
jgi:rhamnosyl/mannosyltransferase